MNERKLEDLQYAHFAAVLNTVFQVSTAQEEPLALELIEARRRTPHHCSEGAEPTSQTESFSLLFAGPKTRFLPQRTYQCAHETLGRFDLFIVPVGQNPMRYHYEAVFNRLGTANG